MVQGTAPSVHAKLEAEQKIERIQTGSVYLGMGTRNLTAAVIDGEYKIAQYGQWDGYPSGQGATIINFLHDMKKEGFLNEFKDKLRQCRWITPEEIRSTWIEFGHDPDKGGGFVSFEIANDRGNRYPHLDRDAGAGILSLVAQSESGLALNNSIEFAADSLFCEYAYVLDFDKDTLEVYRGFNQSPLDEGERFHGMKTGEDSKYCPVRLLKSFSLSNPPELSEFLSQLEEN